MYERQHDDSLLRTADQYIERSIDEESEEEDPEEVQPAEDTEIVSESADDEDPEEICATADSEAIDEGAEGDTEEQAEDATDSEDTEMEAHAEVPVDDAIGSAGIHLPPRLLERVPTPPPLPLSPSDDDFEDLTPEAEQTEDVPPADPDTPPPDSIGVIPIFLHNWILGRVSTELAVAEARLDESRVELARERVARIGRQDGGRFPRSTRMAMVRQELRARRSIRALPSDGEGRISRLQAEEIFRRAWVRVRALLHISG